MKRINKSKEQLLRETKALEQQKERLIKDKYIATVIFPLVENLKTVYDAQTALNAASGWVQYALVAEEAKLKVSDLNIDLSKQKDGEIGSAVEDILIKTKDFGAKDVADMLSRMGQKLAEYVTTEHMKDPMTIKTKDFIA